MLTTTRTLNDAALINFLFAGDAIFTLVNEATGTRYTYRVNKKGYQYTDRQGKLVEGTCYWVSLLTGPQNTSDYTYLGSLKSETQRTFALSPKSRIESDQLGSVQAISWLLRRIELFEAGQKSTVMVGLVFYHAGRCGRCARVLTTPESCNAGIGPECSGRQVKGITKPVKMKVIG